MSNQEYYYIEVTDTFSGEANYSWVTRHVIKGKTKKGAVNRFSRLSGMNWHCVDNAWDYSRFDSASGATCYFISDYDEDCHSRYRLETDDRS